MFVEALGKILDQHATPAQVRAIESGAPANELWQVIEDSGFLDVMRSEPAGGAGLSWLQYFELLRLLGQKAQVVPIAETMAVRALLPESAAALAGPVAIGSPIQRARDGQWKCAQVTCGMLADWVLVEVESQLGLVDARMAWRQAIGGAGSLLATLSWDAPAKLQIVTAPFAAGVLGLGAVVYSGLLAGAMQRVTAMTLRYCNERSQFGRSIGKFQAVQHQLSAMAEQVAAASIAAESALVHDLPSLMDCALAKARASEAAPMIAATAHALHGAIGVTAEYDLQLYTRRLHEWRAACGGELYWQQWLGSQVLASHTKTLAEFVRTAR